MSQREAPFRYAQQSRFLARLTATELPGANTQGATLDEARLNLGEAISLVLQANRALSEDELDGADVIREPLKVSA